MINFNIFAFDVDGFGLYLRKIRKENGLTVREFAKRLDIDRGCIYNWEKGDQRPGLVTVIRIFKMFDLDLNILKEFI